jgi:hypothetical protein
LKPKRGITDTRRGTDESTAMTRVAGAFHAP